MATIPPIPTWCDYVPIVSEDWDSYPYSFLEPYVDKPYYEELINFFHSLGDLTRDEIQTEIWKFVISKECVFIPNGEPPEDNGDSILPTLGLKESIIILSIIAFIFLLLLRKSK